MAFTVLRLHWREAWSPTATSLRRPNLQFEEYYTAGNRKSSHTKKPAMHGAYNSGPEQRHGSNMTSHHRDWWGASMFVYVTWIRYVTYIHVCWNQWWWHRDLHASYLLTNNRRSICVFRLRIKERISSRRFACPLWGNIYRVGCIRWTSKVSALATDNSSLVY